MDVGMEVMETLVLKREPLSEELIERYTGGKPELLAELKRNVDILERCQPQIPIDIMVSVCRCSKAHIAKFNKSLMEKLCRKALHDARLEALREWGGELETPRGPYWS